MLFRYRGITFGGNTRPLIVTDHQPPTLELRSTVTPRLQRDGVTTGREYLGSGAWSISVVSNVSALAEALELVGALESAWKDSGVRAGTATVPLDYSTDEGASWHRVYGRPGKAAGPTDDVMAKLGVAKLELEFVQMDPWHYSATERQATLTGIPSVVGGIVAPIVAPITTVASGAERADVLQNDGDRPSPARVRFYGPCSNPLLTCKGLTVGYLGTLAYDQWVELSAWDGTVRLSNGASVAGRVDRRTVVSQIAVPAGRSEWTYRATDVTGTSRAVVYWRDAHTSLQ